MITWTGNCILYIIFQALLLVRDPVLPHAVASADQEPEPRYKDQTLRPRGWSDRDESGSVSRRDNRERAPLEYRSKRASHPQRAGEVTPKTDKRKRDLAAP